MKTSLLSLLCSQQKAKEKKGSDMFVSLFFRFKSKQKNERKQRCFILLKQKNRKKNIEGKKTYRRKKM
jgi:hypothetical protein